MGTVLLSEGWKREKSHYFQAAPLIQTVPLLRVFFFSQRRENPFGRRRFLEAPAICRAFAFAGFMALV